MDNLHSIINQRRHYTANHPDTAERTNNQQDNDSSCHSGYVVCNSQLVVFPWNFVECHADKDTDCGGSKQ